MSDDVIKNNEWLIYNICSRYKNHYNFEDLYQAGCIGLVKAYNKYDKNSNAKFSSYAYKYILGEIIDFIKKDRNIIVSDEYIAIYKKYEQIKSLLFSKYEREVSFKEICSYMNIDEEYLLNIIETIMFTKSIEDDSYSENYSYNDSEEIDNRIILESELEKLDDFEKSLIDYRYYYGYTQSETASVLGVSQVKVSRKEKLILTNIKNNLSN